MLIAWEEVLKVGFIWGGGGCAAVKIDPSIQQIMTRVFICDQKCPQFWECFPKFTLFYEIFSYFSRNDVKNDN